MRNLAKRIGALEAGSVLGFRPWHRIILEDGQSEEEAIAAYEAAHGLVGNDGCFIIRFITPEGTHA